jgi:hypothetical protein
MAKCALVGCKNPPVGGVEEIIDAGDLQNPFATLPGLKTSWCREHEEMLKRTTIGKRVRRLTLQELNQI